MKSINKVVKIKPPIRLNFNDKPNNINAIPKYIGFLEQLKIPDTTKDEAVSILIGLIVVLCSLNERAAVNKIPNPNKNKT